MSESQEQTQSPLKRALRAIEDLQGRLDAVEYAQREPIAIIGMACRVPGGAKSPEQFYENLRNRVDAITEVPKDRFDIDEYYDARPNTPGKTHTRYGGFIDGIEEFDPVFVGVAPKNAYSVDPQQRVLGGQCWAALEDAGIAPTSLDGSLTGVFVGIWGIDYWHRLASRPAEEIDANVIGGNTHSVASGSISYMLGLRGPSVSVDTACSSSLVTVDLACQSLRNRNCDLALAGGVNVVLGPENFVGLSAGQVLAPDGRCKTFDAAADGFGRGEGAGVVVLKRLADALRDGDRILAVVAGSCVNQDGKTSGITVPNGPAQEEAVRRALAQARLRPADVQYVEAHGTGTSLGDPIEVVALGHAYGEGRSADDPLLIGSVKSNIGHLEAAAGVVSLIKVVQALQHEELPPNLHFENPNPEIPWSELPVKVVADNTPWKRGSRPRYAGVSSFGASGTNVHVVVGEAPALARPEPAAVERSRHVVTLSVKSKDAMPRVAARLADHLERHPELAVGDVCFTANIGRAAFKERLALVASSASELREALREVAEGRPAPRAASGRLKGFQRPSLAFVFTGQGSQYAQMGRTLFDTEPAFRKAMEHCDEILAPHLPGRLLDVVYPAPGAATPLDETTWTQPALFAIEYALAETWSAWGVVPDVVMGHSIGEYVAACRAGVFSLEDALRLVSARSRLMGALPREGSMVAVLASEAQVLAAIAPFTKDVSIAALNGPANVVVSGRTPAVEAVVRALESQQVETRALNVSHAFHSPLMEPMLADFERVARDVRYSPPRIALVSNLTGAVAGDQVTLPEYWVSHVRQAVRFADGVRAVHEQGTDLFLEVGPKPVLSGMGALCLPAGTGTWMPSLRPGQDEWERVLLTLGELWVRGVEVDWKAFDAGRARQRVSLPTYPFKGDRYWIEAKTTPRDNGNSNGNGHWLESLVEAREQGRLPEELRKSGRLSEEDVRFFASLLDVVGLEYARRATGPKSLVADYYNAIPSAAKELEGGSQEEVAERYLTFGPFHEIVPGFSWIRSFADPVHNLEGAQMSFEAQKEMREALFRLVDFERCRSVLDFGCGYASDIVALAQRHPHLACTGYTIAGEQARIGLRKVESLGLQDRVQIFNRDSARDEFPGQHDLVFGFEVAHHVPNKRALFANIGRHMNEGGRLVLADFISRAAFAIDHEATSSFFITSGEWSELLAENQIEVVDGVDISQEIANFLHDPNFDETLAKVESLQADANIRAGFKSYDQLGRLLRQRLTDYVLLTAEKRSGTPVAELVRRNREKLDRLTPYSQIALPGACYETQWVARPKAAPASNGHPGGWIVLADATGVADALCAELDRRGERVVRIPSSEAGRDLRPRLTAAGTVRGVVHLWSLDAAGGADIDARRLEEAQSLGTESVLEVVQALAESAGREKPRLFVVTRRIHATEAGTEIDVAHAALAGLGKSILVEHPELWGGMVDLDGGEPLSYARGLADELVAPEAEFHVAYRNGERRVARLVRRRAPREAKPTVRGDASYLVSGGLGALGLRVARWLAAEGARNLVLTGRREPEKAAQETIAALEAQGVRVTVARGDVAREEDVLRIVRDLDGAPPLRGVVQAAGVLDDGVLLQQTRDRLRAVMAPKVLGTLNLHRATAGQELDFFVCFSSAAALFGSAGQGNYAAANAFMDAFAHHRRAAGLPALSVNWGAWAETGMAAALTAAQRRQLFEKGVGEIPPDEGLRLLGALLAEGRPQVGVSPMSWERFFDGVAREAVLPYFERLAPEAGGVRETAEPTEVRDQVAGASGERRREIVTDYLQGRVAKILGYPDPRQIDRELTLLELGFDSLMAVQLRNAIRSQLGTDLPIGKLFDSVGLEGLAGLVDEKLAAEPARPGGTAAHVEVI